MSITLHNWPGLYTKKTFVRRALAGRQVQKRKRTLIPSRNNCKPTGISRIHVFVIGQKWPQVLDGRVPVHLHAAES